MASPIPYLLSLITFLPLAGALVVTALAGDGPKKRAALVASLVTFLVSLLLWLAWENG